MTIERFRDLYSSQPFRPFIIHLAEGRDLTVHHREFIALGPGGRTALLYQPDESFNIVDLLLVTDIEVKGSALAQAGSEYH